jgi:transcriptional regulator with XRE-family HTH domain
MRKIIKTITNLIYRRSNMPIGNKNMIMTEIIADNVRRLIEYHNRVNKEKLTQSKLAARSKVSQRTISNVLRPGSTDSVTSDTIEKLAKYFGLEPYHLVIPNLPIEELIDRQIERVIDCYTKASKDGRDNIKRIAEFEVRYAHPKTNGSNQ